MKKTYVMHCMDCKVFVLRGEEKKERPDSECPAKVWAEYQGGVMFSLPKYKEAHNYPQRAVNLPGEPIVNSFQDYKNRARAAGQEIVGDSAESRYRGKEKSKKRRSQGKRDLYLHNGDTGFTAVKRI